MNGETSRERSALLVNGVGVDRETILTNVSRALDGDVTEAEELVLLLRVHIGLLIPVIEELARILPDGEQGRCLALASVAEAQRKLRAGSVAGAGPERRAQQLARVCRALIFHWEELRAARLRTLSS
jgi:hypothetical protein